MIFTHEEFPHGVLCEGCDQPFREGEEIALYPYGMVGDGIPIVTSLCPRCVSASLQSDDEEQPAQPA